MDDRTKVLEYGVGPRARVGGRLAIDCGRPGCRMNDRPRCISPSHMNAEQVASLLAALAADAAGKMPQDVPAPIPSPTPSPSPSPAVSHFAAAVHEALGLAGGAFWDRVREVAAEASKVVRWEVKTPDGVTHTPAGVVHSAFKRVLLLASAGVPVMLVGPAGCGKTFLAEQVAEALGLPFHFTSLSGGLTESALVGRQTGIDGTYHPSEFVRAYEGGGVWLGDEMDAADPNVLLVLNAALAGKRMPLDKRPSDPYAVRNDRFQPIGAMNTWGSGATRQFVGRNQLDGASLSRWRAGYVSMDYDPEVEKAVADAEVYEYCAKVRTACRTAQLRRDVDTRYMVGASKIKAAGGDRNDWAYGLFADWTSDEVAKIPQDLVPASARRK